MQLSYHNAQTLSFFANKFKDYRDDKLNILKQRIHLGRLTGTNIVSTLDPSICLNNNTGVKVDLTTVEDTPKGLFYFPLRQNFNPDIITADKDKNNGINYINDKCVDKLEILEENLLLYDYSLLRVSSMIDCIQRFKSEFTENEESKENWFDRFFGHIQSKFKEFELNVTNNEDPDLIYEVSDCISYVSEQLFPVKSKL